MVIADFQKLFPIISQLLGVTISANDAWMQLQTFFARARSINNRLMQNWSFTNSLQMLSNNIPKTTMANTMNSKGWFLTETSVDIRIHEMNLEYKPTILKLIQDEPWISCGFDNFQQVRKKKYQTYGESAVTLKGTVRCIIRNKIVPPSVGSYLTACFDDNIYYVIDLKNTHTYGCCVVVTCTRFFNLFFLFYKR